MLATALPYLQRYMEEAASASSTLEDGLDWLLDGSRATRFADSSRCGGATRTWRLEELEPEESEPDEEPTPTSEPERPTLSPDEEDDEPSPSRRRCEAPDSAGRPPLP